MLRSSIRSTHGNHAGNFADAGLVRVFDPAGQINQILMNLFTMPSTPWIPTDRHFGEA
jgi:hypothetical protein